MTALADPSAALRARLGEPELRRRLRAMVSRRVSAADADDVVQSVLCDALASDAVPATTGEIPRWLTGIARHKVADLHRRARRDARGAEGEPAAPPAPFEARVVLREVDGALASPGAREALEWLVRAHGGEPLDEIARREGLAAAVVRQRVSRLRRALRARWLAALVALAAAGGALRLAQWARQGEVPIVAEPAPGAPRAALARVQGEWRVEGRAARVRIEGTRVTIDAAGLHTERALSIDAADPRSIRATLRGASEADLVDVRFDSGRLLIHSARGDLTLTR